MKGLTTCLPGLMVQDCCWKGQGLEVQSFALFQVVCASSQTQGPVEMAVQAKAEGTPTWTAAGSSRPWMKCLLLPGSQGGQMLWKGAALTPAKLWVCWQQTSGSCLLVLSLLWRMLVQAELEERWTPPFLLSFPWLECHCSFSAVRNSAQENVGE